MALVAQEIPKVGLVMENARLVRWLKEVGDIVSVGEPLLELETEKSLVEIEATVSGRLAEKLLEVDQEAKVGDKIAWVETDVASARVSTAQASGSSTAPAPRARAALGNSAGGASRDSFSSGDTSEEFSFSYAPSAAPASVSDSEEITVEVRALPQSSAASDLEDISLEIPALVQPVTAADAGEISVEIPALAEPSAGGLSHDSTLSASATPTTVPAPLSAPPFADSPSGAPSISICNVQRPAADAAAAGAEGLSHDSTSSASAPPAAVPAPLSASASASSPSGAASIFISNAQRPAADAAAAGAETECDPVASAAPDAASAIGAEPDRAPASLASPAAAIAAGGALEEEKKLDAPLGEVERTADYSGAGTVVSPAQTAQERATSNSAQDRATNDVAQDHAANSSGQERATKNPATARVRSSPLARRVAQQNGVEIGTVKGTGPRGRVQLSDVRRALEARSLQTAGTGMGTSKGSESGSSPQLTKLPSIRRAIARSMTLSNATVPQFIVERAVDWTALHEVRGALNAKLSAGAPKISVNDFLLAAVSRTLLSFPALNATFVGDASSPDAGISQANGTHIGLVVAIDNGLLVPVIHNIEQLKLPEVARRRADAVDRALKGRLKQDDLEGATFSISNLGARGPDRFTAIINPPQSAILAVGRQRDCVVARKGGILIRPMSDLSLTVDHRVADGRLAADFLAYLVEILEGTEWRLE